MIGIDEINNVFDTLAGGGDGEFRHVIDMESLRSHKAVKNEEAAKIPNPDRGKVVNRK